MLGYTGYTGNVDRECRFKIKVKNTGFFHCAARYRHNGWAFLFLYKSNSLFKNPCLKCNYCRTGKAFISKREVAKNEWADVAGNLIKEGDWDFILLNREREKQ